MRLDDLFEKRSNPDKNPRIPALEQLRQYKGRNLFVSFTRDFGAARQPKLGINPRSGFDTTPLGIYCYPLDYVLGYSDHLDSKILQTQGGISAPYSGDVQWKFLHVFALDTTNFISEATPERKCDYIRDTLSYEFNYVDAEQIFDDAYNFSGDSAFKTLYDQVEALAKELANTKNLPAAWTMLYRKAGVDGIIDDGFGIIHDNEPTQTVVFNYSTIKPVTAIKPDNGYEDNIRKWDKVLSRNSLQSINDASPESISRLNKWSILRTLRSIFNMAATEEEIHHSVGVLMDKLPEESKALVGEDLLKEQRFDFLPMILAKISKEYYDYRIAGLVYQYSGRAIDFIRKHASDTNFINRCKEYMPEIYQEAMNAS